jgi:hypothetical protein
MNGPIGKLILLALVVAAVWYGWKYLGRLTQIREEVRKRAPRPEGGPAPSLKAEETTKCQVCGAYVAAGAAGSCGRVDCPFGARS